MEIFGSSVFFRRSWTNVIFSPSLQLRFKFHQGSLTHSATPNPERERRLLPLILKIFLISSTIPTTLSPPLTTPNCQAKCNGEEQ